VNRSGPGLSKLACCCEPRNEMAFLKGAEFLDQLKNCTSWIRWLC